MKYITHYDLFENKKESEDLRSFLKKNMKKVAITTGVLVGLYLLYKRLKDINPFDSQEPTEKSVNFEFKKNKIDELIIYDKKDAEKAMDIMNDFRDNVVKWSKANGKVLNDEQIRTQFLDHMMNNLNITNLKFIGLQQSPEDDKMMINLHDELYKELKAAQVTGAGLQFYTWDKKTNWIMVSTYGDLSEIFYDDAKYKKWSGVVRTILIHEFVHFQQIQNDRFSDVINIRGNNFTRSKYIANKGELEANMASFVDSLKDLGYTKKTFLSDVITAIRKVDLFGTYEVLTKESPIIKTLSDGIAKQLPA